MYQYRRLASTNYSTEWYEFQHIIKILGWTKLGEQQATNQVGTSTRRTDDKVGNGSNAIPNWRSTKNRSSQGMNTTHCLAGHTHSDLGKDKLITQRIETAINEEVQGQRMMSRCGHGKQAIEKANLSQLWMRDRDLLVKVDGRNRITRTVWHLSQSP